MSLAWPGKGRISSLTVPLRSHTVGKRSFQRDRRRGGRVESTVSIRRENES